MVTEEYRDKNLAIFVKKLGEIGIETDRLMEKYGDAIKAASFTHTNEDGMAYDGSMLDIVLRVLTPYALKINEMMPERKRIEKDSVIKVALLHHVAKAIRLVPNDNEWEVEKRNMPYKFNNDLPSIKNGAMSLAICQECGIPFTLDEVEAMTINDTWKTDPLARMHCNTLSTIMLHANELTYQQFSK